MLRERSFNLSENSYLMIEYPEQRNSEVKRRFLEFMKKGMSRKDYLAKEKQRQRIRTMLRTF